MKKLYADVLDSSQSAPLNLLFGLRSCVQVLDMVVGRWLEPDALTPGRFRILVALRAAGGHMAQRDVVKQLGVTRATTSALIAALEQDRLVKTTPSATDKRQVRVELTVEGLALIERLVRETTTNLRRAFAALEDQELETLTGQLRRLALSVSAFPGDRQPS